MKKIVVFFIFLLCALNCMAQTACTVSYSAKINDMWGAWSTYSDYYYGRFSEIYHIGEMRHPSEYCWKLTLEDFVKPSKEDIKKHYKNKIWWEYNGLLEYYVTDENPSALAQVRKFGFLFVAPRNHDVSKGQTPCVKRVMRVFVRIQPYKDYPRCYNIHFRNPDDMQENAAGFAIVFETNALNW